MGVGSRIKCQSCRGTSVKMTVKALGSDLRIVERVWMMAFAALAFVSGVRPSHKSIRTRGMCDSPSIFNCGNYCGFKCVAFSSEEGDKERRG